MSVYVSPLMEPSLGTRKLAWLLADGADELRRFAARLELPRRWHRDLPCPHYVVGEGYRWQAFRRGAVELDADGLREIVAKWTAVLT